MEKIWIRSELKERGKAAIKKNYWAAVIISVILALATASGSSNGSDDSQHQTYHYQTDEYGQKVTYAAGELAGTWSVRLSYPLNLVTSLLKMSSALGILALGVLLHFFLANVLEVGCRSFYIENIYTDPGVGRVLSVFRSGAYGNVVLTMFLRDLYIFLWTLLLIVPGIIKGYEYRMVPYLLAENPDMPAKEALERSKDMMYGQKWDVFVLDLSFLLWKFLSSVTLGIAGVFFVNPYIDATDAELYDTLAGYEE